MNCCIKKYIKVTPIYVVLIFNGIHVRWEIFKNYQTIHNLRDLLKRKYKIKKCIIEIYREPIINNYDKISKYLIGDANGLDIHITTTDKIYFPEEL